MILKQNLDCRKTNINECLCLYISDFEKVNHTSLESRRRNCCDDNEGSDDDFEFIS